MRTSAKITSKGQVTIPKKIREVLKGDVVEFEVRDGNVVIKSVVSVAGSLERYAGKYQPIEAVREKTWEEVANGQVKNHTP